MARRAERYGTWQSVYGLFRAWRLAGTWAAILTSLQALDAEAELIDWTVSVDSTINRAHQHAAGARRDPDAQLNPPIGEPIAIGIRNRYAALHAARLQPGRTVELPEAPFLHLFVPRGTVTLEGAGELGTGDAVRFTAPAVSGSPPPRRPRCSCGRCTRPSPPELSCCCTERKVVIMTENDPRVVDNPEAGRFEVLVDGEVAGFAEYRRTTSAVAFTHTVIDPAFEGRGLGSVLARGALDATREAGSPVLPFCPFIRGYIQRHPAYLDLVPADRRAEFALAPASDQPDRP